MSKKVKLSDNLDILPEDIEEKIKGLTLNVPPTRKLIYYDRFKNSVYNNYHNHHLIKCNCLFINFI